MGFNKKTLIDKTLTVGKEALNYLQIYTTLWYKLDYIFHINLQITIGQNRGVKMTSEIIPDAELDCVGLYCPIPIARTKQEIDKLAC